VKNLLLQYKLCDEFGGYIHKISCCHHICSCCVIDVVSYIVILTLCHTCYWKIWKFIYLFISRTVALFESTAVCEAVSSQVSNHLQCLLGSMPKPQHFAVRSSAVGEDSEDLSSAGQNKTVLGVRGELADILGAIQSCWASLYTLQSVQYRR
jgi:hypothetical protein